MMFAFAPLAGPDGATAVVVLLAALALDAVLDAVPGLRRALPDPAGWAASATRFFDRRLNRPQRSEATRLVRGAVVALVLAVLAAAAGWLLWRLGQAIPYGFAVEFVALLAVLGQRRAASAARAVAGALRSGGLEAGRAMLTARLGVDAGRLDAFAVARVAVERLAGDFLRRLVGPVFWYLVLGLPGAFVYAAAAGMDEAVGHNSLRHRAFGFAASGLDDALGFLPARIAALLLAAATVFVPSASPHKAVSVMWHDGGRHRALNAGWLLGAVAGGLGLALGGPDDPKDGRIWIGDGRARIGPADVRRALYLQAVACLLHAGLVAGLLILMIAP